MASSLFGQGTPEQQNDKKNNGLNLGAVMEIVQQYGNGDPKAAFFNYAKKLGVDPQSVLSQIKL